jgi:hypothetical protein
VKPHESPAPDAIEGLNHLTAALFKHLVYTMMDEYLPGIRTVLKTT